MLMLVNTADARYRGDPDEPDDERERRWEPISSRLFLPAAASVSCLVVSAVTAPLPTIVLVVAAVGFCARFVFVALAEHPPADDG